MKKKLTDFQEKKLTLEQQKIIELNYARATKVLDKDYDAITGVGSPLERFPFKIKPDKTIYLLESILEIDVLNQSHYSGKDLQTYCSENRRNFESVVRSLNKHRLDHDFEFWAFICAKIKPKKGGDLIPFRLNPPQRKLLKEFEADRTIGKPNRTILLKSRQWGGSTLTQIYMAWIQLKHKKNWNSLIAAHLNGAASNIRGMYSTLINNYQAEKLTYGPFEGTQNTKIIKERNCKITIGSMQTPDSIRSEDVAMAHLSEVGLWKKTDGKEPKDLVQSIVGTVSSDPDTMIVMESTAKGVGNYFHETWQGAKKGTNAYKPVFIPWFDNPEYVSEFKDDQETIELVISLSEYELQLWNLGASLEGIKWYRAKLKEFNGDEVRMKSEFPSTDIEAFQGTGNRFFAASVVAKQREFNIDPYMVGDIFADAYRGPQSISNMRFEKSNGGKMKIWEFPDLDTERGKIWKNRYCVTVDIGGRSKEADDSVIKVFDRCMLEGGGMLFPVAVWAGKADFDHVAWKAVQICKYYGDAFMVPEINKQRESDKFDEGTQFYTLVDEIADHYDNIFCRTTPEQIREGLPRVYGFHTNAQTKPMILNALNAALRDCQYIEYDSIACDQYDTFENKGDNKTGAVQGSHDDHVIASALGVWACLSYMEPVQLVDIQETKKVMKATSLY